MKKRGIFITFEGCEGSGKSMHSEKIYQVLITLGLPVLLTREPGGTRISDQIREMLLALPEDPKAQLIVPNAELLLYLASRAQHVEELILPALKSGKVVLCDRFADATVAYQGYGRGLDLNTLKAMNEFATQHLKPDFTILLDIDPKTGLERSRRLKKQHAGIGKLDRIEAESLGFHREVKKGYLAIAREDPERVSVHDTDQPFEENHVQILRQVLSVIKQHGITRSHRRKPPRQGEGSSGQTVTAG